jgi:hypothetical protein
VSSARPQNSLPVALDDQAGPGHLHAEKDTGRMLVTGLSRSALDLDGIRPYRAHLDLSEIGDSAKRGGTGRRREVDIHADDSAGNDLSYGIAPVRCRDLTGIKNESHAYILTGGTTRSNRVNRLVVSSLCTRGLGGTGVANGQARSSEMPESWRREPTPSFWKTLPRW